MPTRLETLLRMIDAAIAAVNRPIDQQAASAGWTAENQAAIGALLAQWGTDLRDRGVISPDHHPEMSRFLLEAGVAGTLRTDPPDERRDLIIAVEQYLTRHPG